MNIYLSAGHRGRGTGAYSKRNGDEADHTIMFRNRLYESLKAKLSFRHKVRIDSDGEEESRVIRDINNFCGNKGVAIEFHFDASSKAEPNGSTVFIADEASNTSISIAEDIAPLVSDMLGVRNRGVRREKSTARKTIGFLRQTKCPAVLIELCFLTNDDDIDKFNKGIDNLVGALTEYLAAMANSNG